MGIMRTKSVEQSIRDTEDPEFKLNKSLGPIDLTVFGIQRRSKHLTRMRSWEDESLL